eukprot:Skav210290  [mRNA]  locus=scaffold475:21266:23095:- [translate_table: standard]
MFSNMRPGHCCAGELRRMDPQLLAVHRAAAVEKRRSGLRAPAQTQEELRTGNEEIFFATLNKRQRRKLLKRQHYKRLRLSNSIRRRTGAMLWFFIVQGDWDQ